MCIFYATYYNNNIQRLTLPTIQLCKKKIDQEILYVMNTEDIVFNTWLLNKLF